MKSQDSAMLLMHWTSSCTIKHDTETVRLYFIEAKDALVADGRCLLFLINFLTAVPFRNLPVRIGSAYSNRLTLSGEQSC